MGIEADLIAIEKSLREYLRVPDDDTAPSEESKKTLVAKEGLASGEIEWDRLQRER